MPPTPFRRTDRAPPPLELRCIWELFYDDLPFSQETYPD